MPRRDLSNRDEFGDFKNRYEEPLGRQINLRPFSSDEPDIEAIAEKFQLTNTEVVRAIVHHWILTYRLSPDQKMLADALKKILT